MVLEFVKQGGLESSGGSIPTRTKSCFGDLGVCGERLLGCGCCRPWAVCAANPAPAQCMPFPVCCWWQWRRLLCLCWGVGG